MAISANSKKLLLRIVLFLVYLLLGATIFHFVEHDHEEKARRENDFKKTTYANFTAKYNISEEDMKWFFTELKKAMKYGYDLDLRDYPGTDQWGFMNAFHFVGNVVTTIGYGHLAPMTTLGRFLCIFYALFGIPLTGLTLRSIGNRISEGLATLIKLGDRRFYNRETEKLEIKTAIFAFGILLVIIVFPAIGFHCLEKWSYTDAVYFCFITLTTIGFGDFVPGKTVKDHGDTAVGATLEFLNLIYMVVGLAVMSGVIVSISGVIEEKTKNFGVDPMDALRNIGVENLNSRAFKKLGLKMGPGVGDPRAQRLPPKMASRTMGVPVSSAHNMNSTMTERSGSAETMEFQGPTPVLYLNKQINGTASDTNNTPAGSPPGTKMFNNKVAPVSVTDAHENITKNRTSVESLRRSCEHVSTETETAEEARSGDDENAVNNKSDNLNGNTDSLQASSKRDSKNELVVEVQVTPMPSPMASPIPLRTESPPALNRSDPDLGDIETYEESIKGSIDSSAAFGRDRTIEEVKPSNTSQGSDVVISLGRVDESKPSGTDPHALPNDSYAKDVVISMDDSRFHEMAPIESVEKHSGAANGFLMKGKSFGPSKGKVKPIEHIDLGDKSVSRIAR